VPERPRILLLGATGFLGRHIRAALEADGRTGAVVGVARTLPEPTDGDRTAWHAFDLVAADAGAWRDLLDGARPDVVVNAAGCTAGTDDELRARNVTAVEHLLGALTAWSAAGEGSSPLRRSAAGEGSSPLRRSAAGEGSSPLRRSAAGEGSSPLRRSAAGEGSSPLRRSSARIRLVHLGSAAEYGPAVPGRPTVESDEPRPVGPYGRTKLAGTLAVQDAAARGADTVVLRVFNPIGAGVDPTTMPGAAARRMAAALAAGERRIAMGPLGAHRDFVAAADVASAVAAAVHAGRAAAGEILNVGSGRARPARDLVHALAAAAGYTGAVDEADEGRGSDRSASVSWSEADLGRIAKVLDWHPSVPFEDAVAALWAGVAVAGAP
jgi:nucleoside-diphosphate-sugar epimerase